MFLLIINQVSLSCTGAPLSWARLPAAVIKGGKWAQYVRTNYSIPALRPLTARVCLDKWRWVATPRAPPLRLRLQSKTGVTTEAAVAGGMCHVIAHTRGRRAPLKGANPNRLGRKATLRVVWPSWPRTEEAEEAEREEGGTTKVSQSVAQAHPASPEVGRGYPSPSSSPSTHTHGFFFFFFGLSAKSREAERRVWKTCEEWKTRWAAKYQFLIIAIRTSLLLY